MAIRSRLILSYSGGNDKDLHVKIYIYIYGPIKGHCSQTDISDADFEILNSFNFRLNSTVYILKDADCKTYLCISLQNKSNKTCCDIEKPLLKHKNILTVDDIRFC